MKDIESSYAQGKFVQDGDWATIMPAGSADDRRATAAASVDDRKAAGLCAEELAKRQVPPPGEAAQVDDEATVAQ